MGDPAAAPEELLQHVLRFRVRSYELDENGHVNNAVYLQWAENLVAEHAESAGFGRAWSVERGGAWVVRLQDRALLAEVRSEWVWVRTSDGRPVRVPPELTDRYRDLFTGSATN